MAAIVMPQVTYHLASEEMTFSTVNIRHELFCKPSIGESAYTGEKTLRETQQFCRASESQIERDVGLWARSFKSRCT